MWRFVDSKWNEVNDDIPIKTKDFGVVTTKNEQYIIILGGRSRTYGYLVLTIFLFMCSK